MFKIKSITRRDYIKKNILLLLLSSPYIKKTYSKNRTINESLSIINYYKGDWQEAFKAGLNDSDCIVIPKGTTCDNFNFELHVPTNKKIIINGTVCGNGHGKIILNGNNQITGIHGVINDVSIVISGGTPYISNLELSGYTQTARIYIDGKENEISNLIIDNLYIHDCNYGILRQGKNSKLVKAQITNCIFKNIKGDAIEWNVAVNDEQILIANHNIENINNTAQKGFWGIGIGLSGAHYDNSYPINKTVKNFTIENINGKNLRQLIHVENGSNFIIRNITAKNISDNFSTNAGLESATIAVYGSQNFTIDKVNIENGNGIIIGFGVNHGKYISAPQNFVLSNVIISNEKQMKNGLKASLGNKGSFATMRDIEIKGATLSILNKPESLTLRNIKVKTLDNNEAISILENKNDPRNKFNVSKNNKMTIINVEESNLAGTINNFSSIEHK